MQKTRLEDLAPVYGNRKSNLLPSNKLAKLDMATFLAGYFKASPLEGPYQFLAGDARELGPTSLRAQELLYAAVCGAA